MPTLTGFSFTGGKGGIDLGDSWLMGPDENGEYTVPGTLISTFTTSGTFTPPSGTSKVNVVIVAGGGNGGSFFSGSHQCGGGAGGTVRVYRDVPVTGPVSVLVGGSATNSSFGSLVAEGGESGSGETPGRSRNLDLLSAPGFGNQAGQAGPLINGTYYAGGGRSAVNNATSFGNGAGTIGRGGASGRFQGFSASSPGSGNSGCVLIYKE